MRKHFISALPVWEKGKEREMNSRIQFKAVVGNLSEALIKIATSGMYNLFINDKFIGYGPARAGKNHFRMDEINISDYVIEDENVIIIEVTGYNVNSFAIQNQPSFLQAEIIENDNVIAYTGNNFTARRNPNYYRKVPRISGWRTFIESYHVDNANDTFFTDTTEGNICIEKTENKTIITRYAPYPEYKKHTAVPIKSGVFRECKVQPKWRDRIDNISDTFFGFKREEWEVSPAEECVKLEFASACDNIKTTLKCNEYSVYKLPFNTTGILSFTVNCNEQSRIYILYDEILNDNGNIDFRRMAFTNIVRFDLCKGTHNLKLFDVYTMQYIQIVVVKGGCEVEDVDLTEYTHPPVSIPKMNNYALQKIGIAAAENFCQNSVDIFMDCPSRERAGWLCDSFFTARAERKVTGSSLIEKSFLGNFLHEEKFEHIPDGMFPMCYPADFYDGNFLPQWSLWLILQLNEYFERSGDRELINNFENRIHKLLSFFEKHENSDGLLESLPGWNFIEWSKANDFVSGVSYPTNMLYSAALKSASELYSNKQYAEKSEKVKREVLKQSFNGEFFVDNAERVNGELILGNGISEVCQYYAFFMGIATKETHKDLFHNLIENFGPNRKDDEKAFHIHPAAPFIGYFLRLDILEQNGFYNKLAQDIQDYFYHMAETTGTIWEHARTSSSSCCHGFACYILCWLDKLSKEGY